MKMQIEAARALTYYAAWAVDRARAFQKLQEAARAASDDEKLKSARNGFRTCEKLAKLLTPMCKYYASEMCNNVTYEAISVLGGSGYMKDYKLERLYRDARITSIYEGTSELQAVAIRAGLLGGALDARLKEMGAASYPDDLSALVQAANGARLALANAMQFVKEKKDSVYTDLVARRLSDMACDIYMSYLFLQDARRGTAKKLLGRQFIPEMAGRCRNHEQVITSGADIPIRHGRELLLPDVPEA
jgi:hypothetical protein